MRVVFMGTPDFAVSSLEHLIADGHEVVGVFTQPDKPRGRHQVMTAPPVKECALIHEIPVYQPESLKNGEAMPILDELRPDIIVVAAYGQILRSDVLEYPKYGCINVHASLLPKYRGAAPINWVIVNGETETGVTIMQMGEGLDTGDMLLSSSLLIEEDETAGELFDRLAVLGGNLLSEALEKIEAGTIVPVPQDDSQSCYAKMLSKKDSTIDWNRSAAEIHNQVRGLSPWPTAMTTLNDKQFKLHKTRKAFIAGLDLGDISTETEDDEPGTLYRQGSRLFVKCGDGQYLELLEVQPLGSRRMSAEDYLRGHNVSEGKYVLR